MKRTKGITHAAIIAALYVVLTYLANLFGLSSGAVQVRISEALTVLPFFTPAAIPGLTIGCLVANIVTGSLPWDIVFGSLATLLGAVGTYLLRKKSPYLAPLPPIIANTLIVPVVLAKVYGEGTPIPLLAASVFAGELISCGVLGMLLLISLNRSKNNLFKR
ncbi:MAG: QueT transporter family protein [Clostridia bacterium]|nr:QueT transporter family protein [Clostridia bacterium]